MECIERNFDDNVNTRFEMAIGFALIAFALLCAVSATTTETTTYSQSISLPNKGINEDSSVGVETFPSIGGSSVGVETFPSTVDSSVGVETFPIPSFADKNETVEIPLTEDSKTAIEDATTDISIDDNKNNNDDAPIFTLNPCDFLPNGLVMIIRVNIGCGRNGGIIQWLIPGTDIVIFEWNEDYKYGMHYHVMIAEDNNVHNGYHWLPGEKVPEPWATIYFGGK